MINKYKDSDICLFRSDFAVHEFMNSHLKIFRKQRENFWQDNDLIEQKCGMVIQTLLLKDILQETHKTIYPSYKNAYLWFCFITLKSYLVLEREMIELK